MNTISIIGRITGIPELRHTAKGTAVCNGNIAVDDPYNRDTSFFFGATFFGRTAEILVQHVTKGQKLGITGRLSQEVWTPPGGDKPVRKTHIVCERFDFLERPRGSEPRQAAPPTEPAAAAPATNGTPASDTQDTNPF